MKHYIISAISNLRKKKIFTVINIVGLSFGVGTAIALTVVIIGMFSFDGFHDKKDSIYKICRADDPSKNEYRAAVSALLGPAIKEEIPEVKSFCRFMFASDKLIGFPENFVKGNGYYADSNWFNLFTFPLVYGNAEHILASKDNIAISEKYAKTLFGNTNPIGQTLNFYSCDLAKPSVLKVSGVFRDISPASSLKFDFIVPYKYYIQLNQQWLSWQGIGTRTYLEIPQGANLNRISEQIKDVEAKHNKDINQARVYGLAPLQKSNNILYKLNGEPSGGLIAISLMAIISIIVLITSITNYINLSIATAANRTKEISIRKVNGAGRKNLVAQFFTETLLVVLASTILSFIIQYVVIEFINRGEVLIPFTFNFQIMLIGIAVLLVTTFIAAWYPSVYMSKFSPVNIDKSLGKKHVSFSRRAGTVFQFVSAMVLIAITLILTKQFNYMANQSLGMDRYNVVYFTKNLQLENHREAFQNELLKKPGIESLTFCNQLPFSIGNATTSIHWPGKQNKGYEWYSTLHASALLTSTFKMNLIDGRDFSDAHDYNKNVTIINRAAADLMEMENPIGQVINYQGTQTEIVGLVQNFPFHFMGGLDSPLYITYRPKSTNICFARLAENQKQRGINSLKETYKVFSPDFVLDYSFLDEQYNQQYKFLQNAKLGLSLGGFFSILIACLGLLGLTVQTSERSVKELGIRKINGARVKNILGMLAVQLYRKIILAIVISIPLVFLIQKTILQNFALQVPMGIEVYLISITILITFTSLVVGWHIILVSRRNPVEALKYE